MDEFPEWAKKLLAPNEPGARPHTLNLALKLADPNKLPLMLLDVATSQPTIQRAMKDLAFLHFARFVPSWDGTALVVTTEFDGPIKPYVMDFVISLGDLFNKLLSYVEEPPPLPVQQYPDEFWTFVEKWNRVPFAPRSGSNTGTVFPISYDYPVYAAYPDKTVVDIKGPRDVRNDCLRPTLDRKGAKVDPAKVQGNILRGYRAQSARHLMLYVTDPVRARAWLAQLPVQDAVDWDKNPPKRSLLNLAFTYDGLSALLPARAADLARFPEAFRQGPARRADDNGDRGAPTPETSDQPSSAPANWRFGGTQPDPLPVHVLLSLHRLRTVPEAVLDEDYDAFLGQASQNGLMYAHDERTEALLNDRVYFGYRDGISETRIAGQCPVHTQRLGMQPASSPGEFLLGKGYDSIYGGESMARSMPADLADNGCYGALRMIEQDVAAFASLRRELGRRFGVSPTEAGARLLGRWPQGQPLSLYLQDPGPPPDEGQPPKKGLPRNDFDYAPSWEYPGEPLDHAGVRCPLDAHIRRTNPRSHHAPGMRHTRRLLRRGMPMHWSSSDGKPHVGLMGLFLCADLERQFEFIQRQWVQGGESGHSEAISGVRSGTTPFRWAPGKTADIPPLVYTRGSLYLFFPGMDMLRALPGLNHGAPLPPPEQPWPALDDLGRQLQARINALKHLPPQVGEIAIEFLLRHVLPSEALEKLVKGLLPPSPPDLHEVPATQQIRVGALKTRFIQNPCRTYRRLRDNHHDFFWERDHQAFWALRRSDVSRIVAKDQEFVQAPSTSQMRGIITLDGEQHQIVRAAFWDSLQAPMAALPQHLDAALDSKLGELAGLAQFDIVRDLSDEVLPEVFWQLFGLPQAQRQVCSAHAAVAMRQFSQPGPRRGPAQPAQANAGARLLGQLAIELGLALLWDLAPLGRSPYADTLLGGVAARTRLPLRGISALSGSQRTMDFEVAAVSLLQFVLAGHLAPQLLFSSATHNFLAHNATADTSVWTHLAELAPGAQKAALGIALEEARRFDPPVTIIQRFTKGVVMIGGLKLQADTPVFGVVASANRDGPAAARLDDFIWNRTPAPQHFSLGAGPHHCIGAALQEMMLPRMLSRIMADLPTLRLVDPAAVPAWIDNIYFRGLESLPVTLCRP